MVVELPVGFILIEGRFNYPYDHCRDIGLHVVSTIMSAFLFGRPLVSVISALMYG